MDPNYRATSDEWAALERESHYTAFSCILELRARIEAFESSRVELTKYIEEVDCLRAKETYGLAQRIEALEAAQQPQQDKLDRLIAEDARPTGICPATPAPGGGLVERLKLIIAKTVAGETFGEVEPESWDSEARAAIREIAAATDQMAPDRNLTWERVALWLEREASQ